MSASADISLGGARSETTPAAPNWSLVPFPVGCARCGQDLHGLAEPKCPLCGLEFEWSEAVPVEQLTCEHCGYHLYGLSETRCPECGEPFTWEGALELYHRRRKPLFEYWWRRRPVRSLIRSWWLAMRPWKLWRTVDIYDPPAVRGLILLLVVACVFFVVLFPVLVELGAWGVRSLEEWADPQKLANRARILGPSGRAFWGWRVYCGLWNQGLDWYPAWLLNVGAWAVASFLALLVFQQSMSLCRVRTAHVFRAVVYAILPMVMAPTVYCALTFGVDVWQVWTDARTEPFVPGVIAVAFVAATWFWITMSLALAYRRYIRMKHAWGVALSTQAIALMFLLCVIAAL